ncbi:MAG: Crp/Fnr family transcriptional regulator [FCB group bacterium]|nr:Crp/Fnr family transcriptional regulator [FCB group bacterium]
MAEQTKLWYLQNFNLFKKMPEKMMSELEDKTGMKASGKREIIYFPDEPNETIYFLKKGKVKLSRITEDGKSTVLQIIGPGEIFGETSLLGADRHSNIAEVMEDAVICTINKDHFQDMMMKNPALNLSITKFIGWRMRKISAQAEDLVFKDARQRICSFIVRYVKEYGKKMLDGWVVRPSLSQQEIADLTAVSRQTASQILNDLKEEGLIDFTRRYIRIKDPDKLS